MFKSKRKTIAMVVASLAVVTTAAILCWDMGYEACERGLTRATIARLTPIATQALQDKNYPEATRAICLQIALEAKIEHRSTSEKIMRLQGAMTNAPVAMQPIMETVLARWYWQYTQENGWRFHDRTRTAKAPGEDFTTWDLPRLLAEVDRHFTAALTNEAGLKAIRIEQYSALFHAGSLPDTYRPTLFDFLAFDALNFYQTDARDAATEKAKFEIAADSPVFAPVAEFLKWQPATTDTDSRKLKAIRLYQNLLAFHRSDTNKTAFIDADLWRLEFGKNHAAGPELNDKYKAALKRFSDEWANHEISALALFAWASVLQRENELAEARKLAKRGAEAYPQSNGGVMCHKLVQEIEAKEVNLKTDRVWTKPWPVISVHYKNLNQMNFRAVRYDYEEFIRQNPGLMIYSGQWSRRFIAKLLSRRPAAEWKTDLPATADFRARTETVAVPQNLKPGFYFILASHDPKFGKANNPFYATFVWVSELALIVRPGERLRNGSSYDDGALDGFVLKALTGEPVAGATVRSWKRLDDDKLAAGPTTKTDKDGMFSLACDARELHLLAQSGDQAITCDRTIFLERPVAPTPSSNTVFFTDRSLYRPGQAIQYKGICYRTDKEKSEYAALAGQPVTVVLRDPVGREISRQQHQANDYGSFSGTFAAPAGAMTGEMSLQVANGPSGEANFNVEEYKRAKFRVALARPPEAGKLGEEVTVPGKVTAYTGAPVGGAKIQWRVWREVRFPSWRPWGAQCGIQEFTYGVTTTGDDGTFAITFRALPDRALPEKTEPIFTFRVSADVTDDAGETRSQSRSVQIGYTALAATIDADEWQTPSKPVEWTVGVTSLDGEHQAVEGTLKIHALKQPELAQRATLSEAWIIQDQLAALARGDEPKGDPAKPDSWELAEVVAERAFTTDAAGQAKIETPLKAGVYRAAVETRDRFGKAVTAYRTVQVVDPDGVKYPVKVACSLTAPAWSIEPGGTFTALWGTGYDTGRAYVEVTHGGKLLQAFWTGADRTQELIKQAVTEEMRGGFTIRATYVRENRVYQYDRVVDVPWSNKKLAVKWEHFTSKLDPGQQETWTAVVSGAEKGRMEDRKNVAPTLSAVQPTNPPILPAAAEMVATLYDASLDQYMPHHWIQGFDVFRREYCRYNGIFGNGAADFEPFVRRWSRDYRFARPIYRHYPAEIPGHPCGCEHSWKAKRFFKRVAEYLGFGGFDAYRVPKGSGTPEFKSDLDKLPVRKKLNETVFFLPHLMRDSNGVVRMQFTMPEALTEWKFMGFAHDRELRSGFLQDKVVTAKELMVEPNPPRFVREGDVVEFTVKVSNQSAARHSGTVRLSFADAWTLKEKNSELGIQNSEYSFDIPSKESKSFAWKIAIPDGCEFLTYKVVGATDRLSDGEEGYLPVLSRRVAMIESLPLPIRGAQTKQFEFTRLKQSGQSQTLRNEILTVQMVSQPAWYAVMALPYLMEYPYESSEAVFNRLYANALAGFIANADPKIRGIFDQWANTPTPDSPLEKNQDLQSVLIEETPWWRESRGESQTRRHVGLLFDAARLDAETKRACEQLGQMQLQSGWWPWFPTIQGYEDVSTRRRVEKWVEEGINVAMRRRIGKRVVADNDVSEPGAQGDPYITLYITAGYGRMRHLGVENVDMSPALKSLDALDSWMDQQYRAILKDGSKRENHLSPTVAFYLYGRSFFLKDRPIAKQHQDALDYWLRQGKQYWLHLDWRQSQGHLAIGLKRFGDVKTPAAIMQSIKEHSVSNEELGMFWRDTELSWWWYRAPIETQALMIEAFDEVMGDAQAVEDCKVWLLKQKQTQDWKTTKATADAVYGLLLRGTNLLGSDALVEVSLGGSTITPAKVEAGTGYYEQKFVRGEIKPEMGKIEVKKTDAGVSWGSVHWQYLENIDKVTSYDGTPLKLKKTIYRKVTTKTGPVLEPVKGPVAVGDELVCRIELRADRDMEYVHLKDQRGSGTEPVNVLSQTKYQDGLSYYESTRDTASHFFIQYLPKGVYVFEYSVRVQLKGQYPSGIASIQCLYAPEFNSHSESFEIEVQ